MKKIIWQAGYYEWHLIIGDEISYLCYVEGDSYLDEVASINGQILYSDLVSACETLCDFIRYNQDKIDFEKFCDNEKEIEEVKNILNSLTDEEWKQVLKQMIRGYGWHYGIVNRQFEFDGLTFEAVGNILGGSKARLNVIINDNDNSNQLLQRKFNRNEFYKVAKKEHLSCDVYRIIGDYENYYMLGNSKFFKVNLDECKFKTCDEYPNRYRN